MKKCFKKKKQRNTPQTLLLVLLQAAIFRQSSIKSAAFSYCQPLVKPKRPCQLRALGRQVGWQDAAQHPLCALWELGKVQAVDYNMNVTAVQHL